MIKLIAVDMDGTLLNDSGLIPDNSYRAVKYMQDNGIKLVIATGRPLLGVTKIYDELDLSSPIITANGAQVFMDKNGPSVFSATVDIKDALHIIKLNRKFQCTLCMWHDGILYVDKFNDYSYSYASITGITPIHISQIDLNTCPFGPTKFVLRDTVERISRIYRTVQELIPHSITAVTTQADFLEFFSSETSKGKALEFLINETGIDKNETIAIGDGHNDMDMLYTSGFSIAVSNAAYEVKKMADYVGCSNNEGILDHIVENILKKNRDKK